MLIVAMNVMEGGGKEYSIGITRDEMVDGERKMK